MLATTLARGLGARGDRAAVVAAGGPGLTGMTRLALSSWTIWKDILATNGDYVGEALSEFQSELGEMLELLKAGALEEAFREGADFAAEVRKTDAAS